MKKNEFEIFTNKEFDFVPKNIIVIKNIHGWVFLCFKEGQVYTNSTNSGANCPKEENETWLKRIVKQLKLQMKTVK